jgi:hypothetical protein
MVGLQFVAQVEAGESLFELLRSEEEKTELV